ncbi:MAG: HD domain-containing protein [Chloroflexi bacterium]|nr:HD domain-containing protein [Chloroflexota bacterium]MCL5108223.1 HD domain-containing protein [Chloroflexota bacterium]
MGNRPAAALYIAAVVTAGAVLLASTLPSLSREAIASVALLAVLCAVAQGMPVSLFATSSVSVALAFALAAIVLYGPAAGILVNLPSILVHGLYPRRRPIRKIAFNLGLVSCAAGLAGLVYLALGGELPAASYPGGILPMAGAALCYYAIDCCGVALVIRLTEGGSFASIWRHNYRWLLANYLAIAGISLGMALAFRTMGVFGLLVFSLPLVMAWHSFKMYVRKSEESDSQKEVLAASECQISELIQNRARALATMIGNADSVVDGRPEVVMRLAADTARHMQANDEVVTTVKLAAALRDVGTIGIPQWILQKPGALTREETALVQEHAQRGAEQARRMLGSETVAKAVLHHHERFDGRGYPAGLEGTSIPIEAQILAVVDAYTAIVSKRPYRAPLPHETAVAELRRHSGTQFNPAVVDSFVAAVEGLRFEAAWSQRMGVIDSGKTVARQQASTGLAARLKQAVVTLAT